MRLNLGCGADIKPGYVNVDFFHTDGVDKVVDLSVFPWPFADECADEILLLDFLEHFSYRKTRQILSEVMRVLKFDGHVDIQVPDFAECARAILGEPVHYCNKCGHVASTSYLACHKCGQKSSVTRDAGIARIFGGQDRDGNWHHTAFTIESLRCILLETGFTGVTELLKNENNETYAQNWNMKLRAYKKGTW